MRPAALLVVVSVLGMFAAGPAAAPAAAGTLDSRRCEWAFDLNYTGSNGGSSSTTDVRFAWGYLIGAGYSELGLNGTYQRVKDDRFSDPDTSLSIVGPFYTWNWTPRATRATGLVTIGAGAVAGDFSDIYDYSLEGSIGVKLFVGDSAAVTARYFFQSLGSNSAYGDSEQLTGLAIGIALYTNRK